MRQRVVCLSVQFRPDRTAMQAQRNRPIFFYYNKIMYIPMMNTFFLIAIFLLFSMFTDWIFIIAAAHGPLNARTQRQMKKRGKRNHVDKTSDFLVSGVFLVTVINVLAASFTTTASPPGTTSTQTHSHLARASMMASAASAVVLPTTSQPAN